MALEPIQYILIGALVIVGGGGFFNMQRMKKKKLEEEMFGDELKQEATAPIYDQQRLNISPEIEEQIKNYILQYKTTYPRESIEQGILAYNINPDQAKQLVNKYF